MRLLLEGALVSGVTLVGWIGAFHLTTHSLTCYLKGRRWGEMSRHHILNMSEAIVCGLQAVVSSVCGVVVVASCGHDVMRARHPLSTTYAWVMASYFLYDTWAMYQVHLSSSEDKSGGDGSSVVGRVKHFLQRRTLLILHHLVMALIFVPVLIYRDGVGDFFVGCFYCVELSGPFTNMRVVLSRLGLKNTRWYTANGVLMIATFACCRVLVFPYMYLCYGSQHGLSGVWGVMRSIPLHCNLGCLLILLPQLHWLRLMVRGALKISRGQRITEAEEKID